MNLSMYFIRTFSNEKPYKGPAFVRSKYEYVLNIVFLFD